MKITYYLEVVSSWCHWADPMWTGLRERYAGRAEFQWKPALMDASGLPTSYLAGFTPNGDLRFVYSPSPSGKGSGAMGDVLKVSPNGRYAVQALRFRGTLSVAGRAMQTPSKKDSAIILFQLNGA